MLPALSTANVRALLRTVMPLSQLTPDAARTLVTKHQKHKESELMNVYAEFDAKLILICLCQVTLDL